MSANMMRRNGRRCLLLAGVTLGVVGLTAGTALARWSTTGTGTGSVTSTTIDPPLTGNVTLTSATNAVNVAVSTAPTTGAPVQGYRIDRTSPVAVTGACFITASTGNCNAPASGTGTQTYNIVSYRGTQTLQTWNSAPLSRTGTPTSSTAIAGLAFTSPTFNGAALTLSCGTVSATRTCTGATTGSSGNTRDFKFNVQLVNSAGTNVTQTTGAAVSVSFTATGSGIAPAATNIANNSGATSQVTYSLSNGSSTGTLTASVTISGTTYRISANVN